MDHNNREPAGTGHGYEPTQGALPEFLLRRCLSVYYDAIHFDCSLIIREKYFMTKLMRGFCVFFLLILSGCASEQKLLSGPEAGKAVIYIYRADVSADTDFLAPNVRVSGKNLGSLLRRGYFRIEVAPGATQIGLFPVDRGDENTNWPASRNAVVNLAVAAGGTYFVELSLNASSFKFSPATREKAEQAMPELHLLNRQ